MSLPQAIEFYSLRELSNINMAILEYEQMVDWIRPSKIAISLRDGKEISVSYQELKHIEEIVFELMNSYLGSTRAIYTQSILFLINEETSSVKWFPHEFIPNGYVKENNFWVFRELNEIQAFLTYPENTEVIEQDFLKRMSAPRIDPLTNEGSVDEKILKEVKEVNISLNRLIEKRLENNESLQEARINVENQQKEVLNILLMGFIDAFAIHGVLGLGTPSILETYLQLKPDEKENYRESLDKQSEVTATTSEQIEGSNENIALEQLDQTTLPAGAWRDNVDQVLYINEVVISESTEQKSYMDGHYHSDELDHTPHHSGGDQSSVQNTGYEGKNNLGFPIELPVCGEEVFDESSPWADQTMIEFSNKTSAPKMPENNLLPSETTSSVFFESGPDIDHCNIDEHEEPDVHDSFSPGDLPFDGDGN